MPTTTLPFDASELVSFVLLNSGKSAVGFFWQFVSTFWFAFWPQILIVLVAIFLYELLTWNGNWHYNSRNGFSPGFNRLIGSGVFALYSALFLVIICFFFGDNIYLDHLWPYVIHAFAFPLTWLTLRCIGFWVY